MQEIFLIRLRKFEKLLYFSFLQNNFEITFNTNEYLIFPKSTDRNLFGYSDRRTSLL